MILVKNIIKFELCWHAVQSRVINYKQEVTAASISYQAHNHAKLPDVIYSVTFYWHNVL